MNTDIDLLAIGEYVSLVLTVPTVTLALLVLKHYGPRAKVALRKVRDPKEKLNEIDYLVLGIFFGFCGSMLDNVYWGVSWTAAFLGLPFKDTLFAFGTIPNIPFRQLAGTVAAILHLIPVILIPKESLWYTRSIMGATGITAIMLGAFLYYG